MVSRISSSVIGIIYIIAAFFAKDTQLLIETIGFVLFCLALIWFSGEFEYFGVGTGLGGHDMGRIDEPSPPSVIVVVGWILLLLPPLVVLLGYFIVMK